MCVPKSFWFEVVTKQILLLYFFYTKIDAEKKKLIIERYKSLNNLRVAATFLSRKTTQNQSNTNTPRE